MISPRSAGVTCKSIIKMKATRHINLQSKRSPGAFYMRKQNDVSAVGGRLRRGCILIRNRDGWVGVVGVGCFSFGGTVQYIEESNIYLCFVVCRLKRGLVT